MTDPYHNSHGISASGLKLMAISPLHYWAKYLDPNREPDKQTPAMAIGSALHALVLEPETFAKLYAIVPEGIDKRSKIGKELFAEIEADGHIPLKMEDNDNLGRIKAGLLRNQYIRTLLEWNGAMAEKVIRWTDEETGAECKMKADLMIEPCQQFPNGLILDLKTTSDASAEAFKRTSYNLGYHIQAAWYSRGFQVHYGTESPPEFIFAAVETDTPYAAAIYRAGVEMLELGAQKCGELLQMYADCKAADRWTGYNEAPQILDLPAWVKIDNDEDIEVNYV